MSRKLNLNIVLLILISMTSLFFANTAIARIMTPVVIYTEASPIISVTRADPEFMVRLKANPTTGYSWKIAQLDEALLRVVQNRYVKPAILHPGSGGHMEWLFRVPAVVFQEKKFQQAKQISTDLVFTYARPWAPTDNPTRIIFKVRIVK